MDRRQGSFLRIADVNGGLVMSSLARCELRFQIAPMARSKLPVVTPNVLRLMFLRTAAHRQSQRGEHDDPSRPMFVHVQAPECSHKSQGSRKRVLQPPTSAHCKCWQGLAAIMTKESCTYLPRRPGF